MNLIYEDLMYNDYNGDLVIDVTPIYEDCSYEAHNIAGNLCTIKKTCVGSFIVDGATFFCVGNNGEEIGQYELGEEALSLFEWLEYDIMQKLADNASDELYVR